jgi:TetR/AcrR family transcriptional regulator
MSSVIEKRTRMSSDDRRDLVLEAATTVFAETGYSGTTTDAVARAAGVSQPYVVRMFGTKENLFITVLTRALDLVMDAFRGALAHRSPDVAVGAAIGRAYYELASDRDVLLCLMHAFTMGSHPVIGPCARDGFLAVFEFLREEAGMTAQEAQDFLAGGMLINTVLGLRIPDNAGVNPCAAEVTEVVLGHKIRG